MLARIALPEDVLVEQRLGRLAHGAFQRGWVVLVGANFTFPFLRIVFGIAHRFVRGASQCSCSANEKGSFVD